MGPSQPLVVYFRLFHMAQFKLIKCRWCAWDSNPGRQDGRRRRIHWAMAVQALTQRLHLFCYVHSLLDSEKYDQTLAVLTLPTYLYSTLKSLALDFVYILQDKVINQKVRRNYSSNATLNLNPCVCCENCKICLGIRIRIKIGWEEGGKLMNDSNTTERKLAPIFSIQVMGFCGKEINTPVVTGH